MATAREKSSKPKSCRACVDFQTWAKLQGKKKDKNVLSYSTPKPDLASNECPADSEQLGRATWTYLHTMAAYYPDQPTPVQQKDMETFMRTFSQFYPCGYCAEHMKEWLESNPPRTRDRVQFSRWMCDLHNDVNKLLGKSQFDCSKVEERWLSGWKDGSCD